jgi:hypothetical protein
VSQDSPLFPPFRLLTSLLYSGTYAQAPNTAIVLVGGVRPSQVFWQVSGTFTVGASAQGASFQGIVLAATQVTLTTRSTITGRIYSQTGIAIQQTNIMQPQDGNSCGPSTVTLTQGESIPFTMRYVGNIAK